MEEDILSSLLQVSQTNTVYETPERLCVARGNQQNTKDRRDWYAENLEQEKFPHDENGDHKLDGLTLVAKTVVSNVGDTTEAVTHGEVPTDNLLMRDTFLMRRTLLITRSSLMKTMVVVLLMKGTNTSLMGMPLLTVQLMKEAQLRLVTYLVVTLELTVEPEVLSLVVVLTRKVLAFLESLPPAHEPSSCQGRSWLTSSWLSALLKVKHLSPPISDHF